MDEDKDLQQSYAHIYVHGRYGDKLTVAAAVYRATHVALLVKIEPFKPVEQPT